jgi:hypothetical protein
VKAIPSYLTVFVCLSCAAPLTEEERAAAAYLAVAQDFVAAQAPKVFCLSPVLSYRDEIPLPERTRGVLAQAGFEFFEMGEPQDTSVRVLTLRQIQGPADSMVMSADLMETSISRGSIRGWANAWDYVLDCGGVDCEIVEKTQGEHSDFALDSISPRAKAILAGQGARCPTTSTPGVR